MSDATREIAERYLDEMPAAEAATDSAAFVKRFEERDIVNVGESKFRKDMYAIRTDLGEYRSREYLGSLRGPRDADHPERYPNGVRHVWRGVYGKNETVIVVGPHERDGAFHVDEFRYHRETLSRGRSRRVSRRRAPPRT